MNKNSAYFLAVISETGKELITVGGIKRPIVKAKCCDSNGELSEINLIFSEISQARKSTGLAIGDVVFFNASLGECPEDNLVFYPSNVYIIRKSVTPSNIELSDGLLRSKVAPFTKERNLIVVEGKITAVSKDMICLSVIRPEFLRGEVEKTSHIWVNADIGTYTTGDNVLFVGEVSKNGLYGELFERPITKSIQ